MTVGSQVKQCFATIKHIEATLNELQSKTSDNEAKCAYETASELISETKQALKEQINFLQREEQQYKQ